MKHRIIICCVLLSVVLLSNGCKRETETAVGTKANCGHFFQFDTTNVFYIGRTIFLRSDAAQATSDCPVTYKLQWRWADPNRAATDATQPPLHDLLDAFGIRSTGTQVDPIGVAPLPELTTPSSSSSPYNLWSITYTTHNSNGGGGPWDYALSTYPSSNNVKDSVWVSAEVDCYE